MDIHGVLNHDWYRQKLYWQFSLCDQTFYLYDYIITYIVGLPDPFARIQIDESGLCHTTKSLKSTTDPEWKEHYDLSVNLFFDQVAVISRNI